MDNIMLIYKLHNVTKMAEVKQTLFCTIFAQNSQKLWW